MSSVSAISRSLDDIKISDYPSPQDLLTEKFLDKYRGRQPEWGFGDLGYIVYKRTYARTKDDGTTEEWWETIVRCIRGAQKIGAQYTQEEAERLFDYIFNLKCSFSGRGLWQLGTKTVDLMGMDSLLNCFAAETLVLTRQGWKPIIELAGGTHEIVTSNGKWVKAPFKKFGNQKIVELTVRDPHTLKDNIIRTTAGHEWIVQSKNGERKRVKTSDLKVGNSLPVVKGKNSSQYLSPQGIQHGLVFGDGSCNGYESHVDLTGDTYHYCNKYFDLNGSVNVKNPKMSHKRHSGMPNYYKNLPDINENKPYLMGFLAGWIAADGNVHKNHGSIRLFNKDKDVLNYARDIASVCGFRTSEPYLERSNNPYNGECDELWSISFCLSDEPELLIIRDDHKEKLNISEYRSRADLAKVISIKTTNKIESVYCAEVDGTHTFVIQGNILTGNCWVTKVSEPDDFAFIFIESMLGGGVGSVIAKEFSQELPRVKKGVKVRLKDTNDADYIVPDSKEGWQTLWLKILEAYLINGKSFTYSTICIRSSGSPIKTFGGIAPGPKPLRDGAEELIRILEGRDGKKLRTQDVADIICCGGQVVKSGGVRRTALILQGDVDDAAFINLKRWDTGNIPYYRSNSNNSLLCSSFSHLSEKFWQGYNGNGEPCGLINLKNARRYGRLGETSFNGFDMKNDEIIGANPCAEALLEDKECCNLAEIFLNRIESKEEMLDCAILLYKTQKAIAAGKYFHPKTNEIVHKNMRLGLGITGVCQVLNIVKEWSDYTYRNLRKFDKKYSYENGWPESKRLTVIKPSGTLSLLAGSMPGCHPGYAEYFIRTVRFAHNDPLLPRLRESGYRIEPEILLDGRENHDISVVYFPCCFKNGLVSKDCDAIKQMNIVKDLQEFWADQAVSVTVYYKKEELPSIKTWLEKNYDNSIKTISFLLHSEHGFKQAVLQESSKEEYEEMKSKLKVFLNENDHGGEIDSQECQGGVCPVK